MLLVTTAVKLRQVHGGLHVDADDIFKTIVWPGESVAAKV
ncbi:hypothetical protein ACP70R_006895 [Stipagrostis hirtigluma subsp. patula]